MYLFKKLRGFNLTKRFVFERRCHVKFAKTVEKIEKPSVVIEQPHPHPANKKEVRVSQLVRENCVYGQPTYSTHPHLIKNGELVPGQTVEEFQKRRQSLMVGIQKYVRDNLKATQSTLDKHLLIISSARKKYMSGKIPYVFRQNSDFYYLTGCMEQDTVLMLYITEQGSVTSTLFMRPKDPHAELWDGPRTGVDSAIILFGVEEAYSVDQFHKVIEYKLHQDKPYLWFDEETAEIPKITKSLLAAAKANNIEMHSSTNFIQSMRLFKSNSEMALMRRTCQIASESFNEVISEARPGQSEHHIYALIDYKCRMRNASYLAYPPVVAGGPNATIIHYIDNSQIVRENELVLMDAGCEYGGYTSDITRTWPISGQFTPAQKTIYDMILQLQKDLLGLIFKTGGETLDQLFETMCLKLGKYLKEIGIVPKEMCSDKELSQFGYKYCPHHVSHYLGMDVHDTPNMPRSLRILPGMVFTIEPGIYIPVGCPDVPKEYHGLGIRIEDDVLINTNNEIEVLTSSCVKDRREIETIFKEKRAEN